MKRVFPIFILLALLGCVTVNAQTIVDLSYYQPDPTTVMTLNLPVGAMSVTRFETTSPAKIHQISFWAVGGQDQGDTLAVYLFGPEGAGAYPILLAPYFVTKVYIPQQYNNWVNIPFQEPFPEFKAPTVFFLGVQILGTNANIRMDLITQAPTCATAEKDTMYTSSFWQNLGAGYIPYGAHLVGNVAMNNWYTTVKVEYNDPSTAFLFEDVTQQAGVAAIPNGKSMRIAVADFNKDGYQDILWGDKLYKNNGNFTFTDVAKNSGFTAGSALNMFADVNNDGSLDIVCQPDNWIYKNNGNGGFTRNDQPGFGTSINTQAMAFADFDGDGYPDLFVANGEYKYVKNPANSKDSALVPGAAAEGFMYQNMEDGTFRDQKTTVLGGYKIGSYGHNPYNTSQTVVGYRPATSVEWVDIDNDGDMDLYVTNDRLQPNYLFENQGNGFFKENASIHGLVGGSKSDPNYLGLYGNTRGCDFGDYDNDGDYDLVTSEVVEQFRIPAGDLSTVWKNSGKTSYVFARQDGKSTMFPFNVYSGDVSWGDFNNDGLLDVVFTSGPNCNKTVLLQQNADHTFTDVSYSAGVDVPNTLGVAWADFNNDGALDLIVVSETGLHLFKNSVPGNGNWVAFNLKGKTCNDYAIGARVKVTCGSTTYTRFVTAGKGAGSQQPYTLNFGIGSASKIDQAIIRWPGGNSDTLVNLAVNKIYNDSEYVKPATPVDDVASASKVTLGQNYPNPFSQTANTSIAYNLPTQSSVKIEILDITGAVVKTLVNQSQAPGMYFVRWDGKDNANKLVPSGSYTYVLTANGQTMSKKLVVIK